MATEFLAKMDQVDIKEPNMFRGLLSSYISPPRDSSVLISTPAPSTVLGTRQVLGRNILRAGTMAYCSLLLCFNKICTLPKPLYSGSLKKNLKKTPIMKSFKNIRITEQNKE